MSSWESGCWRIRNKDVNRKGRHKMMKSRTTKIIVVVVLMSVAAGTGYFISRGDGANVRVVDEKAAIKDGMKTFKGICDYEVWEKDGKIAVKGTLPKNSRDEKVHVTCVIWSAIPVGKPDPWRPNVYTFAFDSDRMGPTTLTIPLPYEDKVKPNEICLHRVEIYELKEGEKLALSVGTILIDDYYE